MNVLGDLPKLKRSLGQAVGAHFLHDFSIKMFVMYLWTKFQCHTFFPFQDIKRNVLLSSCIDNW